MTYTVFDSPCSESESTLRPHPFASLEKMASKSEESPRALMLLVESQLQDFLSFVRSNCSYFQECWESVPEGSPLTAYPAMNQESYWSTAAIDSAQVLTGRQIDGVVWKSGGSTGLPKLAYFSHDEMTTSAKELASFFSVSGVQRGDRVANILYVGGLYSSFLGVAAAIDSAGLAIHLPIAGHLPLETILDHLREQKATVVVSIVTQLYGIACLVKEHGGPVLDHVRLLLYGGEALYQSQVALIEEVFPNATMKSFAYGGTESGIIGFCANQSDTRIHVANEPNVLCEIVDDNDEPIVENGSPGRLLITNIQKRLMPMVRYPSGDSACWIDFDARTFRLLGRDNVGVRLGPTSIDMLVIRKAVQTALRLSESCVLQVVVEREDAKDRMRLRFVDLPMNVEDAAAVVAREIAKEKPMYEEHVAKGVIGQLIVENCALSLFSRAQRTGKILELVDNRGA